MFVPLGVPVYHWYVYGPVPGITFDVRSMLCPLSITGLVGDTDTEGLGFTVRAEVLAVAVAGGVAPEVTPVSVTVIVNTQLIVVLVGVYTNVVTLPGLLKPGHVPVFVHEYENVPVPLVAVAVIVLL